MVQCTGNKFKSVTVAFWDGCLLRVKLWNKSMDLNFFAFP